VVKDESLGKKAAKLTPSFGRCYPALLSFLTQSPCMKTKRNAPTNPVLRPLPLAAMLLSTAAMLAAGIAILPTLKTPATRTPHHHLRYVCTQCGSRTTLNSPFHNRPRIGDAHHENFSCVIEKVSQGRYRPVIETPRLLIREATPGDIPALNKIYSTVENGASNTWTLHKNIQETETMVYKLIDKYRNGKQAHWLIAEKSTGKAIGLGGFNAYVPADNRDTLGWTLDSSVWGKGYGTELAKACIEYGFKRRGLNRIDAVVRVDNEASRRVLEKAGMTLAGCFRQYWRVKGELLAHYQYVVLRKDIAPQLTQSKA